MSMNLDHLLQEIKKISPLPDDEQLNEDLIDYYSDVFEQIEEYRDPRIIPILINSLGIGEGFGVYQSVLNYLEQYDFGDLRTHLYRAVEEGQPGSRRWSSYLLGLYRDRKAVAYLIQLLNDPIDDVRKESVWALGVIGCPTAIPYLEKTANSDVSGRVRKDAREAIQAIQS